MRTIVNLMRVVSFVLVSVLFGGAIGYGLGVNPVIPVSVLFVLGFIPLGIDQNCLAVLLNTHTGATSYSGSIDSPIARLMIDADSISSLATVTSPKLTLSQSTKRKTGTLIPELTFAVLADICGFIDAVYYEMTATFRIIFSIPISLGGAYDPEGGSLSYTISGATAGDTIKVYSIDDAKRELDFVEITPVACLAGGVKQIDVRDVKFLFIDPTNITRIKFGYANGLSIEYVGAEISEICRIVNPVHKVTDVGVLTPGYGTLGGINVIDALTADVNLTVAGTVYVFKHLLAG